MGGSMGNPIDEAAQARINQKIEDVVKTFGMEFSKAYTQVVINKAKAEIITTHEMVDDLKLQPAPTATAIQKQGIMVKVSGTSYVSVVIEVTISFIFREEKVLNPGNNVSSSPETPTRTSKWSTTTVRTRRVN
jgi:hypothetical protein